MTIEEIKERLLEADKAVETISLRWKKMDVLNELISLRKKIEFETEWKDTESLTPILRKIKLFESLEKDYDELVSSQTMLQELAYITTHTEDDVRQLAAEVGRHIKHMTKFKIAILLDKEEDQKDCFLQINSGAGGTEAQDWAEMVLRMCLRFCEQAGLAVDLIDYQSGEGAGIKSATAFVKGNYAYGLLSCEEGVHRLVRISPYDANKRRHTSFSAVTCTPEVPDIKVTINPMDLRIDTYRAGGAGGQHVNKTDSAVRITHMPSGIVVQCQNERSQLQNKDTAMKMLKAKLYQKEKEEREAKNSLIERKKIEWGSQIRSYVLHPYKMVKDHRTDYESFQPDKVLDGEIMPFIEAYLVQRDS